MALDPRIEKIISTQIPFVPYTYLIGWTVFDRWYYGSETAFVTKIANPANLWTTYFTSSKVVEEFRREHGEPDVVEVRRIFSDPNEALRWERNVLERIGVLHDKRWLNQAITDPKFSSGMLNKKHSEKTRMKMKQVTGAKKASNYGKIAINDGETTRFIKKDLEIPNGWKTGFTDKQKETNRQAQIGRKDTSQVKLKKRNSALRFIAENGSEIKATLTGRKMYNNGVENRFFSVPPDGWVKGRLTHGT